MSHKNKVSLIGQADARLQKMTQAGVGRSKPEVVHSLCIEINVNHYILRCF